LFLLHRYVGETGHMATERSGRGYKVTLTLVN
jgi:hypothetical protein